MRAPLRRPSPRSFGERTALPAAMAIFSILAATGCARMIETVDLPTMTFESAPPIDASVEICVPPAPQTPVERPQPPLRGRAR